MMNTKFAESTENTIRSVTPQIAYSVEELSDRTSLSKSYLRNEIRAGRLRAKLVGRRVLILAADADNYLNGKSDWNPLNEREAALCAEA